MFTCTNKQTEETQILNWQQRSLHLQLRILQGGESSSRLLVMGKNSLRRAFFLTRFHFMSCACQAAEVGGRKLRGQASRGWTGSTRGRFRFGDSGLFLSVTEGHLEERLQQEPPCCHRDGQQKALSAEAAVAQPQRGTRTVHSGI